MTNQAKGIKENKQSIKTKAKQDNRQAMQSNGRKALQKSKPEQSNGRKERTKSKMNRNNLRKEKT